MWALRAIVTADLLLLALILTGCGFKGESFQPIPVPATPAEKLEGNWLIYGALPRLDIATIGAAGTNALALSLSSDGRTITGSAFLSGSCASGETLTLLFDNGISAVPDGNGHFATSSTRTFGWGFTLTGTAPNLAGRPWSGTYQLSNDGTNNLCSFSGSGSFTATPVGQLTGTFTGSAVVGAFGGNGVSAAPGASLGIQAKMVQGATRLANDGSSVFDAQALQGTVQISGIPCFSSGASSGRYNSHMVGNEFEADFTMDDGSTLLLLGTIDNTLTTHLLLNTLVVLDGKCVGNYAIRAPGGALSR